jgi:hypothetical protein
VAAVGAGVGGGAVDLGGVEAGRVTAEQARLMADTVAVLPVSGRAGVEREILARDGDHGPERLRLTE